MREIDYAALLRLQDLHHADMVAAGWADASLSDEHYLSLIISELGEAIHAHQMGYTKVRRLTKVRQPDEPGFKAYFERNIKDSCPDEMADVLLRILNLLSMRKLRPREIALRLAQTFNQETTYTERAYYIMELLTKDCRSLQIKLTCVIVQLFLMARLEHIDLFYHAELKRRYNQLRTDWKKQKRYN